MQHGFKCTHRFELSCTESSSHLAVGQIGISQSVSQSMLETSMSGQCDDEFIQHYDHHEGLPDSIYLSVSAFYFICILLSNLLISFGSHALDRGPHLASCFIQSSIHPSIHPYSLYRFIMVSFKWLNPQLICHLTLIIILFYRHLITRVH